MLLTHDIRLTSMLQLRSEPCRVDGWEMMGPTPLAFTMHQMKKTKPAVGVTINFKVNRWRLISCKRV
jgi:hypothetical protein